MRLSWIAPVVACVLTSAAPCLAESDADRATARALAHDAQDALESKNYAAAADKFGRADALVHAPTLLLGWARAKVGLGQLVEAQESYNRILREGIAPNSPKSWSKALVDARKEVDALAPRVAWVTITVTGAPEPEVTVDAAPLPKAALGVRRAVNPGQHVVRAKALGFFPTEASVNVSEGQKTATSLELKRDPSYVSAPPAVAAVAPGPATEPAATDTRALQPATVDSTSTSSPSHGSSQKTLGWVGVGLGAAGIVTGSITGLLALSKHSSLRDACADGHNCSASQQSDLDSFHTMAGISTASFIAGGVLEAAGLVLLLTSPSSDSETAHRTWAPYIGLQSMGARGTF